MFTVNDLVNQYEAYTDEELYRIHGNINNYSEDAAKALDIVIARRGGIDALTERLSNNLKIINEKRRIAKEATEMSMNGVDAAFLQNTTTSSVLSADEVKDIIDTHAAKGAAIADDKKVNADTVIKSIIGCGIASIAGGIFWGVQLIYFGATHVLLIIGMALICYAVVKFVTKKSFNNTAVLMSAIVAFCLSFLVGYFLFSIFGYLG